MIRKTDSAFSKSRMVGACGVYHTKSFVDDDENLSKTSHTEPGLGGRFSFNLASRSYRRAYVGRAYASLILRVKTWSRIFLLAHDDGFLFMCNLVAAFQDSKQEFGKVQPAMKARYGMYVWRTWIDENVGVTDAPMEDLCKRP